MSSFVFETEVGRWRSDTNYEQSCPDLTGDKFMQVTDLLLENPNLNSTHLFRADILFDSAKRLKTLAEREEQCQVSDLKQKTAGQAQVDHGKPEIVPTIKGAALSRRVLRRLIPRKPQLDRALEQWCYIYDLSPSHNVAGHVVVYVPQVQSEEDTPWYHPPIKSLAYLYQKSENDISISLHFLPFPQSPATELPSRLHRTLISLLRTFLRLAKNPTPEPTALGANLHNDITVANLSMAPSAIKDTILPQHTVQDTYSRLKQQYAADLISRWVEKTEPSKHVFEDLSIAAFVIELWKQMYKTATDFPGFVDIACGNGVLSYILTREGYQGRGFDARRRKTWEVLGMHDILDEMICIPQPFLDACESDISDMFPGSSIHNGIFDPGAFIISNHADELTPWTPLLGALSSPCSPNPFLAIPCCSHALSGANHRYSPKDFHVSSSTARLNSNEDQPVSGDLKALRAAKAKAANHTDDKSMYACLTRKVVSIAEEVGFDIEVTLMRIPSTRNIGVVGNRSKAGLYSGAKTLEAGLERMSLGEESTTPMVQAVIERECAMLGGIHEAAKTWIKRAQKLQTGKGRGKVNLGRKPNS